MSALRSLLASLGIALAALGLVFVLVPEAAGLLSVSRLGVLLLGGLALVQATRSLRTRWRTAVDGAEPPEPETRLETGWPGDDFDERVAALSSRQWYSARHERLRQRLQAAAVDAAAHRWRLTNDTARERVAAGAWTDDPAAAWFLGGPAVEPPPWSVRARALVGPGSTAGFYANRTADAVVALREAA